MPSEGIREIAQASRSALAVATTIVVSSLAVTLLWLLAQGGEGSDARTLALSEARIAAGSGRAGASLELRLDSQGRALVRVPVDGAATNALSMLRLDARASFRNGRALLFATVEGEGEPRSVGVIDGLPDGRLTVYLGNAGDWSGTLVELLLAFEGPPGASLEIRELRLSSPSVATVLANALQSGRRATPWTLSSINAPLEPRALTVASPWTALLAAATLGVVLIAVAAFTLRRRSPVSPRAALTLGGSLIVACWIAVDLVWMDRQRVNAFEAVERFGSRPADARPLAGPDASFVLLARRIDRLVERAGGGRILVASGGDFQGMRAAYQLYPRNVYWERHAELPPPGRLRSGDYVLLLVPTQHTVTDGALRFPDHPASARAVTVLLETPNAVFMRID